jgi:hypothetical protein
MSKMGAEFIRTEMYRQDVAEYEAAWIASRLATFAGLVQRMRTVQEACFCNENRFDERRRLEAETDKQLRALRPDLFRDAAPDSAPYPTTPDPDFDMPF